MYKRNLGVLNLLSTNKQTYMKKIAHRVLIIILAAILLSTLHIYWSKLFQNPDASSQKESNIIKSNPEDNKTNSNPLTGLKFYKDDERDIDKLYQKLDAEGKNSDAELAYKIATQPSAIWLVGPSEQDLLANKDIEVVARTSRQAQAVRAVPFYMLYAIPDRDACAQYSKNGFKTNDEYIYWIDRIIRSLQGQAIFGIEPDAVAHMVKDDCISNDKKNDRYILLQETITKLQSDKNVAAVYLDAGHSDWFSNPKELVQPLKRAGIEKADGITVNVSFFVSNKEIINWSQKLVTQLGSNKGVVIDTGQNGNGSPPNNTNSQESRWCNPRGRAIGENPTTNTSQNNIDAFLWIKTIGESDGACFGNPPAGVFMPEKALELARNKYIK